MAISPTPSETQDAPQPSTRLHYLDWLRVIAILAVFLFHAVHPFDLTGWHIKNSELSMTVTIFVVFFSLWGMAFFFLVAGTGSWFALRRRTARQYVSERFRRLLVPYVFGAILFMPLMLFLEWTHMTRTGQWAVTFQEFVLNRNVGFSPRWFGSLGYHLWFLGFLFSFSLLTLPLFRWLKGTSGQRFTSRVAQWCDHRGGLMVFMLPLLVVQLALRPFFPLEHDWADFIFQMAFFALGYFLYSDERFIRAIRRDWPIILAGALLGLLAMLGVFAVGDPFAWAENPASPKFYFVWSAITLNALCWTLLMVFIGMRFLDFTNATLRYAQEAVLPFFVVQQPVILAVAFFVVQWNAGIPIKMLVVVLGSFVISLGLYELVIRRIGLIRVMFGVTHGRPDRTKPA